MQQEDWDLWAVVRSCCNPAPTRSLINDEKFTVEDSQYVALNHAYDDLSFEEVFGLSERKNKSPEGLYEIVRPFLVQTSNIKPSSSSSSVVQENLDGKIDENPSREITGFEPIEKGGGKEEEEIIIIDEVMGSEQNGKEGEKEEDISIVDEFSSEILRNVRYNRRKNQNFAQFEILADELNKRDPWAWRKYGQKILKSSPNPRSYYRCFVANCPAKRQIEKSSNDPKKLCVCYRDDHNHKKSEKLNALENLLESDYTNQVVKSGAEEPPIPNHFVGMKNREIDLTMQAVQKEVEEDVLMDIKDEQENWYDSYYS